METPPASLPELRGALSRLFAAIVNDPKAGPVAKGHSASAVAGRLVQALALDARSATYDQAEAEAQAELKRILAEMGLAPDADPVSIARAELASETFPNLPFGPPTKH
mgnify:CR=1 FL=1